MILNYKKFNKEISALKALDRFLRPLHPLRQQQIRHELLAKIAGAKPMAVTFPENRRYIWGERRIFSMRYLIAILLGLGLLSGTVYAADLSHPGDTLYPVKRATEEVRLRLVFTAEEKANLQSQFAERREKELQQVETEGNAEVRARSEQEVQNAIEVLQSVQDKLETKGNANAAAAIGQTIERLQNHLLENPRIEVEGLLKAEGNGYVLVTADKTWKLSGSFDFNNLAGKQVKAQGWVTGENTILIKNMAPLTSNAESATEGKIKGESKGEDQSGEHQRASEVIKITGTVTGTDGNYTIVANGEAYSLVGLGLKNLAGKTISLEGILKGKVITVADFEIK